MTVNSGRRTPWGGYPARAPHSSLPTRVLTCSQDDPSNGTPALSRHARMLTRLRRRRAARDGAPIRRSRAAWVTWRSRLLSLRACAVATRRHRPSPAAPLIPVPWPGVPPPTSTRPRSPRWMGTLSTHLRPTADSVRTVQHQPAMGIAPPDRRAEQAPGLPSPLDDANSSWPARGSTRDHRGPRPTRPDPHTPTPGVTPGGLLTK
jgi:hypothetical protein